MNFTLRNKGHTLVEVLISLAIMSLLVTLATYSYNQYSRYWGNRFGHFDQVTQQSKLANLLFQSVQNTVPYLVKNREGNWVYYFLGREEGFTSITTNPIFSGNRVPAVTRIFREEDSDGVRLVYEEAPLDKAYLKSLDQELNFTYRLILAEAASIRFEYFGWSNVEEKYPSGFAEPAQGRWLAEFDGEKSRLQPGKIRITLDDKSLIVAIPTEFPELLSSASGADL